MVYLYKNEKNDQIKKEKKKKKRKKVQSRFKLSTY